MRSSFCRVRARIMPSTRLPADDPAVSRHFRFAGDMRADQQVIPRVRCGVANPEQKLAKELVGNAVIGGRDNQPQRLRSLAAQLAREQVGLVAECVGDAR